MATMAEDTAVVRTLLTKHMGKYLPGEGPKRAMMLMEEIDFAATEYGDDETEVPKYLNLEQSRAFLKPTGLSEVYLRDWRDQAILQCMRRETTNRQGPVTMGEVCKALQLVRRSGE